MKSVTSLKAVFIALLLAFLIPDLVKAQLEFGGQLHMRSMKPGFGYGVFGELGIPADGSWRLAFRGYFATFSAGVPTYRVIYHGPGSNFGEIDQSKNFTGIPMDSFDRGIGIRMYYQQSELQPFFGIGATYAYNDILSPNDTPENDIIERSLNYDFTVGLSYMIGDNITTGLELHMANITRANFITYESFVGLNISLSYRFGNSRFSNVYDQY